MIYLKPCPFCGAEATMEEIPMSSAPDKVMFSVGCDSADEVACVGYQSFTEFNTRREAAEAWNRRAGWQPIQTAPQNKKVLAGYFNKLGKWRTITACYHTRLEWSDEQDPPADAGEYAPEGWYEESDSSDTIYRTAMEPTDWMPLPEAPQ